MNFILFDDERYHHFLPLTHTRPLSELRCGILTMRERWQHVLSQPVSYLTAAHLQNKYPLHCTDDNILINSSCFVSAELLEMVVTLKKQESIVKGDQLICARITADQVRQFAIPDILMSTNSKVIESEITQLEKVWDIFSKNGMALNSDFDLLTRGKKSQPISPTNTVLGNRLFIEEGARVECSIINTESGPVYIGRDAEVMEGSIIRGPFALGHQGVVKMGAKIYGPTTIGPGCKVGGEVNNSVFLANSNKAHDGFIGNAVIGEWCNLGADTNNSNLKNNYEEVRLWSEHKKTFIKTGLQFCGLIMGDHSKCGINTMLNTGTVIGVSCNIYGAGFPRNFIPSFSWGSSSGFTTYELNKAIDTAKRVFERRQLPFDDIEQQLFKAVFERTNDQRNY
jgi:UDP-N-acetylglucosamine diphosphorylase/glucosamine-1-phosphate N-acetyltransferase